jgi:hypothetical protein
MVVLTGDGDDDARIGIDVDEYGILVFVSWSVETGL